MQYFINFSIVINSKSHLNANFLILTIYAALYCGTLYMPSEPLFFPSLGNKYIFRCSDGIHIDGNDKWISKSIYKSCSARDRFDWDTPACDTSWLTPTPINPLNIGQFVNNRSHSQLNNVIYQECSLTWDISSSAIRLSNVSLRSGEVGDDKFIFGGELHFGIKRGVAFGDPGMNLYLKTRGYCGGVVSSFSMFFTVICNSLS